MYLCLQTQEEDVIFKGPMQGEYLRRRDRGGRGGGAVGGFAEEECRDVRFGTPGERVGFGRDHDRYSGGKMQFGNGTAHR